MGINLSMSIPTQPTAIDVLIIHAQYVNAYLYDHLLLMNNEINFKNYLFKQFPNTQNEVVF